MDKEIRYFVNGYEMLLYLSGDREERKSVDCFELQDFESEEKAVAAARDFISEHKNAVNDQKHGIGSVTYWVAVVERAMEDAVMGWLPCDRDGVTEGNLCRGGRDYRLQRRIRPRIPFRRRGAPEGGCTHHGHHEPVHVVHGKALQAGGCRRPHRIRVDGQGARVACRRARDACRAAMARTMARSRVDTCLGRVKRCFSHALIFAAQVCAIYVVILLSGLLVFWSAIFIDSKGRKFSRQEDSRILRKRHREIGKTMAINRVTIMGNLTRDAELRKKGDATSVLTFGLAINEKKKDSETGEYVDAPVFVDCALFGARAEALAPYLTKGKKVSVDGRLRYHSWMKNEEKRHALSVLVTDIEFADSKGVGKDTVSAKGQSAEPETYDADIPF